MDVPFNTHVAHIARRGIVATRFHWGKRAIGIADAVGKETKDDPVESYNYVRDVLS